MMLQLALFLCIFLVWKHVDGFCDRNLQLGLRYRKALSTTGSLSPLRPVGGEKTIPRLEPGLRFVQARANFLANINKDIKVSKFDLGSLSMYNAGGTTPLQNPLSNLITGASNMASRWSGTLSKYAQRGVNAALIMSTFGAMPQRALTRGPSLASTAAFATASILAAGQFTSASFLSPKPPSVLVSSPPNSQSSILDKVNTKFAQLKSMLDFDMNLMKWKNYDSLSPAERLATTPVYFIANSRGNSYMQNDAKAGNPDQKIVTYFLGYDDAARVLSEMTQMNSQTGGGIPEFRLKVVPLERAVNRIKSHKQSRKLGRYEVDTIYRIQPSGHQYNNAQRLAKLQALKWDADQKVDLKEVNIPLFKAQGFTMTRSNGEVVTPYYFAYEDLLEDWASARRKLHTKDHHNNDRVSSNSAQSKTVAGAVLSLAASGVKNVFSTNGQPRVQVHELADVLCRIQGISPTSTANPFIPTITNTRPLPTTLWGKLTYKAQDFTHESGQKTLSLLGKVKDVTVQAFQRQREDERDGVVSSTDSNDNGTNEDDGEDTEEYENSAVESSRESNEGDHNEKPASSQSFLRFLSPTATKNGDNQGLDTMNNADKSKLRPGRMGLIFAKLNPCSRQDGESVKVKKEVIGIMPPRREIELLRKFYRNQIGFRNEFARAKYLG